MNKKNILISAGFVTILLAFLTMNILKEDEKISYSERRRLMQFPNINVDKVISGTVMNDFEKYALDQFPYRDLFRKAKSLFNFNVYHKLDDNGALIKDNVIYKLEYPLNNKALQENIKKINEIKNKYLENLNVYYSIIPDKSYFLDENYLKLDYTKMQNIMHENLKDMKYINIFENLDIEDYYKTDIHWKQEKILDVADKIKLEMLGKKENIKYNIIELGDFFGSYYGQVGINVSPDKQKYLTNEIIDKSRTYNFENQKEGKVYDLEKWKNAVDKYDLYLSGPTPLIEIINDNAKTENELLLFRDSFGSTLAPLLIDGYKKITLIDLRYINSSILENYIEFKNQDVLFIYSVPILNQNILK